MYGHGHWQDFRIYTSEYFRILIVWLNIFDFVRLCLPHLPRYELPPAGVSISHWDIVSRTGLEEDDAQNPSLDRAPAESESALRYFEMLWDALSRWLDSICLSSTLVDARRLGEEILKGNFQQVLCLAKCHERHHVNEFMAHMHLLVCLKLQWKRWENSTCCRESMNGAELSDTWICQWWAWNLLGMWCKWQSWHEAQTVSHHRKLLDHT
jgi:hypothetical protein